MNITALWDKCLKDIGDRLSDKQMKTWLHPLEVKLNEKTLLIVAPNKFIKEAVETDYMQIIEETVYIGDDQINNLVALKSKEEVIGDIISILQSPAKNLISALKSGSGKVSGILKSLSERKFSSNLLEYMIRLKLTDLP